MGTLLENQVPCQLNLIFHSRDFPKTPYLALCVHVLLNMQVWLWPVCNEGHSTCRTNYLLGCISDFIWRIFLKLHTFHSPCMPFMLHKFGLDRSVTKGTLLSEQSTFLAVSQLLFQSFFLLHNLFPPFMPYKQCLFGYYLLIMKCSLFTDNVPCWLYHSLHLWDFFETPYPTFSFQPIVSPMFNARFR